MSICVTCLDDAVTDQNGQCYECYKNRKITDVWGEEIPHLTRLYKEE